MAATDPLSLNFVTDFAANGNGVADNSANWQAALDAMAAHPFGGTLYIPNGRYVISQNSTQSGTFGVYELMARDDVTVVGESQDGAILDGSAATCQYILRLLGEGDYTGLSVLAYALNEDAAAGEFTIDTSASNFVVGDMVVLTTRPWNLANPGQEEWWVLDLPRGELNVVTEVNTEAGTLRFQRALEEAYNAATTTVVRLPAPKLTLANLTILRDGHVGASYLLQCRDSLMDNVTISGARERGLYAGYWHGGTIKNCYVDDAYFSDDTSYSCAISTSRDVQIRQCVFLDGKHCVTESGWEPNRNNCWNSNRMVQHASVGAIDICALHLHQNVAQSSCIGNHVTGGAAFTNGQIVFDGNTVFGGPRILLSFDSWSEHRKSWIVRNNTLTQGTSGSTSYTPYMFLKDGVSNRYVDCIDWTGNVVFGKTAGQGAGIVCIPPTTVDSDWKINRLRYEGNTMIDPAGYARTLLGNLTIERFREANNQGWNTYQDEFVTIQSTF